MAKETAEQKLLRLIEQGDSANSSAQAAASVPLSVDPQRVLNAVQGAGISFSFSSALSSIGGLFKGLFAHTPGQGFGVRELNRILVSVVGIMAVIFAANLARGVKISKQPVSFDQPGSASFSSKDLLPQFRDVGEYLTAASARNIFHPFEIKVVEEAKKEEPVIIQKISNQIKDLKLVGISWLDTPESASAMLENTGNGVTQFLHTGEKINGVTVEAIYADSIVLEFAGERMELKL